MTSLTPAAAELSTSAEPLFAQRKPRLDRVDRFEEKRTLWTAKLPEGATAEDLMREDFWQPVAARMNRHDIVFAVAYDESWEAECRVEASFPAGAKVSISKKLRRDGRDLLQRTVLGDGAYSTEYRNGSWAVLRTKDQRPVIEGEASENAAIMRWLREQPRKV